MVERAPLPELPEELPQRTLRNDISRVLRDVEAGRRYRVTVNGRVVAELGPPSAPAIGVDAATAHEFIRRARARADPEFWNDIKSMRQPEEIRDPWGDRDTTDT